MSMGLARMPRAEVQLFKDSSGFSNGVQATIASRSLYIDDTSQK